MSRGRKSKYDNSSYTTNKDKWIAALYVRLSVEDGDKDVSTSIESQKQLLDEFLNNNKDIQFYNYYIDDGYSGTDFNRPGFKRFIKTWKKLYRSRKLYRADFSIIQYKIYCN